MSASAHTGGGSIDLPQGQLKAGDTVELTKDVTAGMRKGDQFTIYAVIRPEEAFEFSTFRGGFAVAVKVPHRNNGYEAIVPLLADEIRKVINGE